MPTPLTLPYSPLILVQSDEPLTWDDLLLHIGARLERGVSICLQAETGHDNRGGYFFHFKRTPQGCEFRTFDRQSVLTLHEGEEVAAFVNHVSGRKYDHHMWIKSQLVNFRTDQETA